MWTLPELVAEVATRMAALPAPKNGQVRAVPDERTIRYYAALGLLDRPAEMRGRTALYTARHAAQIVAIKRLQIMGRSLADIQALWPGIDDATLAQMSGIAVDARATPARPEFWKQPPAAPPVELRIALAPDVSIVLSVPESLAITPADIRAIRAAAAPLVAELASRRLAAPSGGEDL